MKITITIIPVLAIITLLLTACGGSELPPLSVEGQSTLVFIYTDG